MMVLRLFLSCCNFTLAILSFRPWLKMVNWPFQPVGVAVAHPLWCPLFLPCTNFAPMWTRGGKGTLDTVFLHVWLWECVSPFRGISACSEPILCDRKIDWWAKQAPLARSSVSRECRYQPDIQSVASLQVLTCAAYCPQVEAISGKSMVASANYLPWITHTCCQWQNRTLIWIMKSKWWSLPPANQPSHLLLFRH